jgi:hypothetical protein
VWLKQHHNFAHIDLENQGLDQFGLGDAWQGIVRLPPETVQPFVTRLREMKRPVVLDWGFPPQWLPLVRALHEAGVTAWWFDADRAAARNAFIRRGTVSVEALDQQLGLIDRHWPQLAEFYGPRIVRVLAPSGVFMTPEAISSSVGLSER